MVSEEYKLHLCININVSESCDKVPAITTAKDVVIVDSTSQDVTAAVIDGDWKSQKPNSDKLTAILNAAEKPMLTEITMKVKSASVVTLTVYPTSPVNQEKIVE